MQPFKYKPKMNTGLLNKRLLIYSTNDLLLAEVWGNIIPKTKRRDDEQNEEEYQFIIRKRPDVEPYFMIHCNDIWYVVLTVEEYQKEKGYLVLRCEKSKIHSFYDTCTVSRFGEVDTEHGETKEEFLPIYTQVPCELVRLISGSANQSDQQNELLQRFELFLENSYSLKVGDKIEITHKSNIYKVVVANYFRTHTHQIVQVKVEKSEA